MAQQAPIKIFNLKEEGIKILYKDKAYIIPEEVWKVLIQVITADVAKCK